MALDCSHDANPVESLHAFWRQNQQVHGLDGGLGGSRRSYDFQVIQEQTNYCNRKQLRELAGTTNLRRRCAIPSCMSTVPFPLLLQQRFTNIPFELPMTTQNHEYFSAW